jgi:hypothetical protein
MKFKKLVLVLCGCIALASCATFDPKIGPTGYNSVKNIPVKDKSSSKIFIIHQPYEWPTLAIKSHVYVDEKLFARTLPFIITLYETKQPKVQIDIYGEYCSTGENVKDYGSSKILLDLKPGEENYLVIREKRNVFQVPTDLLFGLIFCSLGFTFCVTVSMFTFSSIHLFHFFTLAVKLRYLAFEGKQSCFIHQIASASE